MLTAHAGTLRRLVGAGLRVSGQHHGVGDDWGAILVAVPVGHTNQWFEAQASLGADVEPKRNS